MVQNYRAFTQVGATVYVFLNHRFKNEKKNGYMITYYLPWLTDSSQTKSKNQCQNTRAISNICIIE